VRWWKLRRALLATARELWPLWLALAVVLLVLLGEVLP